MKTILYLLSGALAFALALLSNLVFTTTVELSHMPTRLYQIFLWTYGETTQLLYRTNAPNGAVLPKLFSHTQGQVFTTFLNKFDNSTQALFKAMSIFPYLTSALFAAALALLLMPILRQAKDLSGWTGVIVAAGIAAVYTAIGTLINLSSDQIPGLPTLSGAFFVLGFAGLVFARTNPWLMSASWAFFALLTPQAWPLLAAAIWASACYVQHEKQRAWTSLSFFVAASTLAGLTLTGQTQALHLFDTQATSLLHACSFLAGAGLLTLKGFPPKRVTLWRLAPLAMTSFLFLPQVEISIYTKGALIGLLLLGLVNWLWAHNLLDGRKLRGKDSAVLFLGLSAIFALLPASNGETEIGHILGWTVLAASASATALMIKTLVIGHDNGWRALGAACSPVLGGVLGLSLCALFFAPAPEKPGPSTFTSHQCANVIFSLASPHILKNNMRRIAAEPELSLALLSMEKTSVLTLGPLTPGHEDFANIMTDTSPNGQIARDIMRARSLDGVVVCADPLRNTASGQKTFEQRLIDASQEDLKNLDWLTKLDGDTDWAIYLYKR